MRLRIHCVPHEEFQSPNDLVLFIVATKEEDSNQELLELVVNYKATRTVQTVGIITAGITITEVLCHFLMSPHFLFGD